MSLLPAVSAQSAVNTPPPTLTESTEHVSRSVLHQLGQISCTQDALIQIGVITGVVFVVSLLLKRVFAMIGANVGERHFLVAATFRAVSRFTHFLIFALTVRGMIAVPGLGFGEFTGFVHASAGVLLILAFTYAVLHLVSVPVTWFRAYSDKTESKLDDMLVPVVDTALRMFVILGGVIEIVHYLSGHTPTQIITALGVGGLAIGLAAQDTIKNFFGSLMLIVDKPFTLGELVDIGTHTGTVESLGLRSTRLRTPEGHLVSVPNGTLANLAIRNIGARPNIRQMFTVGLTYDTPPAKLEEAVSIIRGLLENHEGMRPALPPRVHLNNLGAYSIDIQVIYWYHPADWWQYNAFNQRLILDILRRLEAAGITIAFPTQTLVHRGLPAASK